MKTMWWIIQVNAVLCFYLFYRVGISDAAGAIKYLTFAVLCLAALLEHLGYRFIYKPSKQAARQASKP